MSLGVVWVNFSHVIEGALGYGPFCVVLLCVTNIIKFKKYGSDATSVSSTGTVYYKLRIYKLVTELSGKN